jgi:ferredoxin/coenzyme F420-reducing hydrogenase delta subunit
MIALVRRGIARGFDATERGLNRLAGPALNPLAQLGALGFFLFWIVAVSGIYLFMLFDTGVENAHASIEWYSTRHAWHAGVMRSFHRYASDMMIVVMALHLVREFARDRYRGARWFSWVTGVPVIWFLYMSGITGYWLVWDQLAQYIATTSTELLDWLPIFGEPIARNFLAPSSLSNRFFTLLVFLHIAVPLVLLFMLWIHIQRITRPKVNPPRTLAALTMLALLAVSIVKPALSQGAADLSKVPNPVGLDWFYLPLYPLADTSPGALWGLLAAATVMLASMPWLPPLRRMKPAAIDLDHCNGCGRCVEDCPYDALQLVPRSDGQPYAVEVAIDADKCVSCGICTGSCPSSTPFRSTGPLDTGIDLPDVTFASMREWLHELTAQDATSPRLLVIGCWHGAAGARGEDVLSLPCVAAAPPSLIDYALSRGLVDGVVVAGCSESACYNRLGVEWMQQRIAGERNPYLRSRVPRERILSVWASPAEAARLDREINAFKVRLAEFAQEQPQQRATETPTTVREAAS